MASDQRMAALRHHHRVDDQRRARGLAQPGRDRKTGVSVPGGRCTRNGGRRLAELGPPGVAPESQPAGCAAR
jgi:hypothetical protein